MTVIVAALVGLGVGIASGLFEGDDDPPPAPSAPAPIADTPDEPVSKTRDDENDREGSDEPDLPPEEDDPQGLDPGPSGPPPSSDDETAAAGAARDYVRAIDDREEREVCGAFMPGGLDALEFPATRGSCAASVASSLGFKGQDGQPVWASSEMTQDVSAEVDGDSARVVATVFTEYADVREPTIEDDIIYLSRANGRWLVVKPSATLYRAVGIADVPLEALQPPG